MPESARSSLLAMLEEGHTGVYLGRGAGASPSQCSTIKRLESHSKQVLLTLS